MPKWQYAKLTIDYDSGSVFITYIPDGHDDMQSEDRGIEILGNDGWELSSVVVHGDTKQLYFKRSASGVVPAA